MNHDQCREARAALENYAMPYQSIEQVGQSANTIYKITGMNNNCYSLRIHRSKSSTLESIWTTRKALKSEMTWLDTFTLSSDLTLPVPYKNKNGEYVTELDGTTCTLLQWVEGEQKQYITTHEDAGYIGEMMGKLHLHSSKWSAPIGFERPCFDGTRIVQSLVKLHENASLFAADDVKKLQQAGHRVIHMMNAIEKTADHWGMIHADIIPSNIVFHDHEASPIDFGACGFGFYLFDLGWTFSYIHPSFRQHVLHAYSNHFILPNHHVELIEGFFIAAQLETMNFWLGLPDAHTWLPNHIHKFVSREITEYLAHESFLLNGIPYWE